MKDTFDEDGFCTNFPAMKRIARRVGTSAEDVEVKLKRAYHMLAEMMRAKGYNIPTNPQQEAEWIESLVEEAKKSET